VMIDNTHVVVLRGTGREMIPVPEMEAFADRFGFRFVAHELGHANRSARVERPFSFIEGNFLAGRTFASWEDLNQQARQWSDNLTTTIKNAVLAAPSELLAVGRPRLQVRADWIAEGYQHHHRLVDVEGYQALNNSRYSLPGRCLGRVVEVLGDANKIQIQ